MIDVRRTYSSRGFRAAAAALIALLVALLMLAAGSAGGVSLMRAAHRGASALLRIHNFYLRINVTIITYLSDKPGIHGISLDKYFINCIVSNI